MKILWLSHLIPYPPKGGVLQRSYNLIRELSHYHEVDLLAFNQPSLMKPLCKSDDSGIEEARLALSHFCQRLLFFEIPSNRSAWGPYALAVKSIFYKPYNINWLKSKNFAIKIKDWAGHGNYDMVHFDTISLVPFFSLVTHMFSTSLDHHNIESHMLLRRSRKEKNLLKRIYFWQEGVRLSRYERHFCPQFSINVTCSDLDTKRLLKISPTSNVSTIPNGVDLEFFKPQGLPVCPNRLIFVGTMNWYPNIEAVRYIAEKIWPILKKRHPDLECDIIGASPPKHIRELSDQHPDFHVHGFIDDVRPYIETATVYVCPICDGGGTKLKILDAMAMAKAVVAHPVACEGINVQDGVNVLLADNEMKFVEHIDHLLISAEKREVMGRAARRLMEDSYSYRSIGRQFSDILQTCVR